MKTTELLKNDPLNDWIRQDIAAIVLGQEENSMMNNIVYRKDKRPSSDYVRQSKISKVWWFYPPGIKGFSPDEFVEFKKRAFS